MGKQLEEALTLRELCKATKQCKKGVLWKDSVANHYLRALTKNKKLKDEVESGRYRLSPYTVFEIYEPKRRTICATKMRDRVLQRSITNNGVREELTRSFIYDNGACVRDRGKDFTVCRTQCLLERYFRRYGDWDGWAAHLDVKSYFPNTPHEEIIRVLRERVRDKDFLPILEEIIESYEDQRPAEEIAADEHGARGIGLGSELSQLVQLALLDPIDHLIKERCRPDIYVRYMDDFLIVCRERAKLEEIAGVIETELHKLGHRCVNKEGVYPLRRGVKFLKLHFLLTETGAVRIKLDDRSMSRERQQLRNFARMIRDGRRSMADVRRHYQSWISMVKPYDAGGALRKMDETYAELFGEKPQYRYRRRKHRHGNRKRCKSTADPGAAAQRRAAGGEPKTAGSHGLCGDDGLSGAAGRGGREP